MTVLVEKVSELAEADALDGSETIYIIQAGVSKRTTADTLIEPAVGPAVTNSVHLSYFGTPAPDTDTDHGDLLRDAFTQCITNGWALILPNGRLNFDGSLSVQGDEGTSLIVRSEGRTTLASLAGNVATNAIFIRGDTLDGALDIVWNNGTGHATTTLNPNTFIAEDVEGHAFKFKPDSLTGLTAGRTIRIQSQRLVAGDNRGYITRGQTFKIKAIDGDYVELEEPFVEGFYTGVVETLTVDSATDSAVTFTGAPATLTADQMVGCRMTFGDQFRYIGAWDSATNVASFVKTTDFGQDAWDPIPANLDTIDIDMQPYVFIQKNMARIDFENVVVDCSASGDVTSTGMLLVNADDIRADKCKVKGATLTGLRVQGTTGGLVTDYEAEECNNGDRGYGLAWAYCHAPVLLGMVMKNCRRAFDVEGVSQTHYAFASGVKVFGGMRDAAGTLWSDDFNYALGNHGQANGWYTTDCDVHDVRIGIIDRGTNNIWNDIRMHGNIVQPVKMACGGSLTLNNLQMIRNAEADKMPRDTTSITLSTEEGYFVTQSLLYGLGPLKMTNCKVDGLERGLLYITSATVGTLADYYLANNSGEFLNASDTSLITGDGTAKFERLKTPGNNFTLRGGGDLLRGHISAASLTNAWQMTEQNKFFLSVADDHFTFIPFRSNSNQIGLRCFPNNSVTTYHLDAVMRTAVASGTFTLSIANVDCEMATTYPMTGTAGTDAKVSFAWDPTQGLWIENRIGAAIQAFLEITGA